MFVVEQDEMVEGLSALSDSKCTYLGRPCDCKYGFAHRKHYRDERTGCPEALAAARIIAAMTPDEFDRITKRAELVVLPRTIADRR